MKERASSSIDNFAARRFPSISSAMDISIILLLISLIIFTSCMRKTLASKTGNTVLNHAGNTQEFLPAFPGAEGFGKYVTGGRGGKIMIVNNLHDKGPGSFREAAETKQPRIILFAVAGTIHLETKLSIRSDATIAGQSAPGEGVCLADNSVLLAGDNIIVRYLRFRMGDKYQKGGMVDGNGGDDAFGGTHRRNIMIDHCSMSWSTDEVCSIYAGDSTTLQWNLIAEPMNYSYHFEKGDSDYEHHGYGGIWGGRHFSAHHNLLSGCNSRTPRFDGIRNAPEENADLRNNVIYNWGHNNVYAGEGGSYNIVNNYYKYGPDTKADVRSRIANPWNKLPKISFGKYFIEGNYMDGSTTVTNDNWLGVTLEKGTASDAAAAKMSKPFNAMDIITQDASTAYAMVLRSAGASYKRDTLDARIVNDVKNRTGHFIDVQGGFPHGTAYELTTDAWPDLYTATAAKDSDNDGIPDVWEKAHGLDPNNAADAALMTVDKNYCNVEVYLNSLLVKS
ncbi:MAG: pectate lyase [Ferruginibacter sp.]